MYQSFAPTPSGRRSSTRAVRAAPAVVIRSTPSAPNPRRRSHTAATRASVSTSSASRSGSSTKSFWVPCPLAKITRSGYLPPRPQRAVDDAGTIGTPSFRVEPVHPVVPAKPRPLPAHVASGAQVCLLPRITEFVGTTARVERRQHLRIPQGPRGGDPVAQALAQSCAYLVDQALIEHRVRAPSQSFIEN